MTIKTQSKLSTLRALMIEEKINFYLVPSSDPHQSEYVPHCWERRSFISEFTGSAGLALIGENVAKLWTDARYFLQAESELDPGWELMKQGVDLSLPAWLAKQTTSIRLGVDPTCVTKREAEELQTAVGNQGGVIKWIPHNLIDKIQPNQPSIPKNSAWVYPIEYAGAESSEKIHHIRKQLINKGCRSLIINRLDSIAWLLNIRGSDIDYNPLCISYLIVTQDTVWWFVHPHKLDSTMHAYLDTQGVMSHPYKDFFKTLALVAGPIWIDPSSISFSCLQAIGETEIYEGPCPVYAAKAIKNRAEIEGARQAHLQDGLALCDFFYWLENERPAVVTEISAARRLLEARQKQPLFQQASFPSISSFGPNAAIIHYRPSEKKDVLIDNSNLYLLDSGGQYLGGTTDVTRCTHLGKPTEQQRYHYTLVLKAHLALRQAVFPLGTCGEQLDSITRQPLWQQGLDFAHGTGHGVGSYLCVHEGPQRIGRGASNVALEEGMIVSNEPGLYFDGEYGIRIESLCLISEYVPPSNHNYCKQMLCLNDLTLFPYEKKLINLELLSRQEIKAIDHYHMMVYNQLSRKLKNRQIEHWLAEKTNPIAL
jgi:Xaa-Pro aminopeptidase